MLRTLIVGTLLVAITAAVYWPATSCGLVDLDDSYNIVDNPHVRAGLTLDGVRWALTTDYGDYWHPLPWLSLMLDASLGDGPDPAIFHLSNLIAHVIASVLMFVVLRSLTGAFWPSAVVAAWFALHPMHVESVAWVTERKDVLSAVFWLLTMWAYAGYARRGGVHRYLLTALMLALGLMCKPMVVTLPLVLLLLDYWPLRRGFWILDFGFWTGKRRPAALDPKSKIQNPKLSWLLLEKLPLIALALGSCLITARHAAFAVAEIPLRLRLANAAISYGRYLGKLFWPGDMAAYYDYPGLFGNPPWAPWQVAAAVAILLAITLTVILLSRRRPYLIVGWLWFLGTLAPVIGVLQVGNQSMADRFTYIPYTGLFIMIAWGAADLMAWRRRLHWPIGAAAAATVVACIVLTIKQIAVWKDTDTLYGRILAVTDRNCVIEYAYGSWLLAQHRLAEAEAHLLRAQELSPMDAKTHFKLGCLRAEQSQNYEAKLLFERALELAPDSADAHYNLGVVLALRGENEAAATHIRRAIELSPERAETFNRTLAKLRSAPPHN